MYSRPSRRQWLSAVSRESFMKAVFMAPTCMPYLRGIRGERQMASGCWPDRLSFRERNAGHEGDAFLGEIVRPLRDERQHVVVLKHIFLVLVPSSAPRRAD